MLGNFGLMKTGTKAFLITLIVGCIATLSCASAENAIKRGDEFYASGQYIKARQEYKKATAIDPEHSSAYYKIANAYLESGRLDLAESNYREAIRLVPTVPNPWPVLANHYYNRGNARLEADSLDSAEEDYNNALRLNPDLPDPYSNLGTFYYNQANLHLEAGQFNSAQTDYNNAIRLNPNYLDTNFKSRLDVAIKVEENAKKRQRAAAAAARERQRLARLITVSDMIEQWEANAVAFESKFFGRRAEVRGIVESVQERVLEAGYRITLRENFDTVDCNVVESNRSMVISLVQGQIVDVAGTVDDGFFGPDLYDCVVTHTVKK